jgi:hypothetical protein
MSGAAREHWWMIEGVLDLRWGRTIGHKMAAVLGTLHSTPPSNSNMAVPWFRRLVTSLSPQRPRFTPGSFHVVFVVDKLALGQVVLCFSPVNIIQPRLSILTQQSLVAAVRRHSLTPST